MITARVTEDEINEKVDELKGEYVYDWEDEFDNIHEAYEEQGRGEAEAQAIGEAIKSIGFNNLPSGMYLAVHDLLRYHWNL